MLIFLNKISLIFSSKVGWYESDVLANQPDPICPEFFAAQAAEYKSFLTQSYDDGYNKQWSNWLQGSYVQLPTTNEVCSYPILPFLYILEANL